MATDTPTERFEEVDWEAVEAGRSTGVSRKLIYTVVSVGIVLAGFLYDYFVLSNREPTIPQLNWDFGEVDWMFIVAFLVFFFYGIYPLYKNPRMTREYWDEFKKNRAAIVSLVFLTVIFLIGTIGPAFLERPSVDMLGSFQPPVFFTVDAQYPLQCLGEVTTHGTGDAMTRRCHGTWKHPFGTTSRGKDILTLIVYGMKVSMQIAFIVSLIVITLATVVGTVAAYVGGIVDEILMRYVDLQLAFPEFYLYLLLLYLLGASLTMFILVFGFFSWGGIARIVRSEALQRREEEFITAANSSGASTFYVIWRHIIPNVSNSVITATTLLIPGLLLFEAGLAFIGLGDPTIPSWGQLIAQGRNALTYAWWISTIPGIFLFLTILSFNYLGQALQDALDPRSEEKT